MVGAGAIGGITAALMTEQGYDVTLVSKYPELAGKISEKGLHIFGFCGDKRIKIPSVAHVHELVGLFDIIFIATKATEVIEAAQGIIPLLKPDSRVVSMQNGIVEEELAKIVGVDRTVGCVVGFGATMIEQGVLEMTSRGEMIVGYLDRDQDKALEDIAKMLGVVVPTIISKDILSNLYSKLIVNSGSSTLGVISGLTLGNMLKIRRARKIFLEIVREALSVADAMQLEVISYSGKVNWYKLVNGPQWLSHLLIRLYGLKYKRLKSSSLQSLERGKRTEVDIFNGYISGKGKDLGIETPVNDLLVKMVHEIEQKIRPVTPLNLEEEYFDRYI